MLNPTIMIVQVRTKKSIEVYRNFLYCTTTVVTLYDISITVVVSYKIFVVMCMIHDMIPRMIDDSTAVRYHNSIVCRCLSL